MIPKQNRNQEHVWLSPRSQYASGRALHIGAHMPFEDPYYGAFASLYAAWSWYIGGQEQHLRNLHIDTLVRSPVRGLGCDGTTIEFLHGLNSRRIANTDYLQRCLLEPNLPFRTYDLIQTRAQEPPIIWPIEELQWYVRSLEQLREMHQPIAAN